MATARALMLLMLACSVPWISGCGAPDDSGEAAGWLNETEGYVLVFSPPEPDGFTAAFSDHPVLPASTTRERIGACEVIRYPSTSSDPAQLISAGTVRVVSPRGECASERSDDGSYDCTATSLFESGDSIRVEASGGDVPPFAVELTVPELPSDIRTMEAANGDLVLSWSGGSGWASASAGNMEGTDMVLVECRVEASAGTLTVPSSVRTMLGGFPVSLVFQERRIVNAGGRRVHVDVSAYNVQRSDG